MNNEIMTCAGRVWHHLNENGECTFKGLENALMAEETPMRRVILAMAVGWLSREDKLSFREEGYGRRYRLLIRLRQ
ncbi:MAG: winged helix-turn-helix domain-containing protein [Candidatus Wallbacteria bacterium]|nr:winged helix-turn-helix domain-containing protein [Candidatus Wallbacteria bacterium]